MASAALVSYPPEERFGITRITLRPPGLMVQANGPIEPVEPADQRGVPRNRQAPRSGAFPTQFCDGHWPLVLVPVAPLPLWPCFPPYRGEPIPPTGWIGGHPFGPQVLKPTRSSIPAQTGVLAPCAPAWQAWCRSKRTRAPFEETVPPTKIRMPTGPPPGPGFSPSAHLAQRPPLAPWKNKTIARFGNVGYRLPPPNRPKPRSPRAFNAPGVPAGLRWLRRAHRVFARPP